MAKYLVHGSYTADGLKGLMKDKGSGRREAVSKAIASAGGKLEALYWALGEDDVYAIVDAPDSVTVAALSIVICSSGLVRIKTTPLLTVEEVDKAVGMAVSYRPPGG